MSETIPEDVMQAAINAHAAVWNEKRRRPSATEVTEIIARAILAERERAAKMCAGIGALLDSENSNSKAGPLLEALAAAIRTPSTGEEQ